MLIQNVEHSIKERIERLELVVKVLTEEQYNLDFCNSLKRELKFLKSLVAN